MNASFELIRPYAKKYKAELIISSILSVATALFEILPLFIIYKFINIINGNNIEFKQSISYALLIALCIIIRAVLCWYGGVHVHRTGYRIVHDMRIMLMEHMLKIPMSFFSKKNTGGLHKAFMEDAERVETLFCHNLPDIVRAAAGPVFCLVLLFAVHWQLALFALLPLPLAFLSQKRMMEECSRQVGRYHAAMERMNDGVQEYVRGLPAVKAFNQTAFSFSKFSGSIRAFRDNAVAWTKISSTWYALFGSVLNSGLVFLLVPGCWMYVHGSLGLAELTLFLMLAVGYLEPLDRLLLLAGKLAEIQEGLKRIDGMLSVAPLPASASPKLPEGSSIVFDHVSFGYGGVRLFNDVCLEVPEGRITALVGRSGAGKTTLALLAARFNDVQEGRVLLGGADVRDLAPETLMGQFSLVLQDSFLFNATLAENIRCARPGASDAEVEDAARKAHIHDFIMSLPEGYATPAGEGGTPLSGGERQRIAIARAILRDAPVVILDEPTSFADPENEVLVLSSLAELVRDKTVVVIAHHLPAIRNADQIVVLDGGRVAGAGRHEDLICQCKEYQELWASSAEDSEDSETSEVRHDDQK